MWAADLGLIPAFAVDLSPGRVIPVTQKLALEWLPCQAPGITGSGLGLVGPVSVYCDWTSWKVICNFCLGVAARTQADPCLRYTSMLLGCKANKQPAPPPPPPSIRLARPRDGYPHPWPLWWRKNFIPQRPTGPQVTQQVNWDSQPSQRQQFLSTPGPVFNSEPLTVVGWRESWRTQLVQVWLECQHCVSPWAYTCYTSLL